MKKDYTIFYSWQSDLPSSENRNLIETCIKLAIKAIKKPHDEKIDVEVNIDRDTLNRSGSPNIADIIFEKIRKSDIFICDVSLINKHWTNKLTKARLSPNPNVLIELGYAIHFLGWERVICVNNSKFGQIEQLPFDLHGHRVANYCSLDKDYKQKLTLLFKAAISSIITEYDEILKRHENNSFISHDRSIFNEIDRLCDEANLMDSISVVVNSLFTNDYYYEKWDNLEDYYRMVGNRFIDSDLHNSFSQFLHDLSEFSSLCNTKFHRQDKKNNYMKFDSEGNEIEMTEDERLDALQSVTYIPHKEPFLNEDWGQADKRIYKLQDDLYELGQKVKSSYTEFIMTVKKKL